MSWIFRAFVSRQKAGEIGVCFYRNIVQCFDRIFAGICSIASYEISIWWKNNKLRVS